MRRRKRRVIGMLIFAVLVALGAAYYVSAPRDEDRARDVHAVGKTVELAAKTAVHALGDAEDAAPTAGAADDAARGAVREPAAAPRTVRLDGQVIELHPNGASGFADDAAYGLSTAGRAADDVAHGFVPVAGVADDVGRGLAPVASVADDVGRGVGAAAGFADDVARGVSHAAPLRALGAALKWIFAPVIGGAAAVFGFRRKRN